LSVTAALERLLAIEVDATVARRLAGRLRFACLPTPATLEDFDYDAASGVCWTPFTKVGRHRYCTEGCRKTVWTRRHATPVTVAEPAVPQGIRRRDITIYACPTCETRYHGEQWCHDCNQPCTRVGLGGSCPHCSEPVAISDLIDTLTTSNIR